MALNVSSDVKHVSATKVFLRYNIVLYLTKSLWLNIVLLQSTVLREMLDITTDITAHNTRLTEEAVSSLSVLSSGSGSMVSVTSALTSRYRASSGR